MKASIAICRIAVKFGKVVINNSIFLKIQVLLTLYIYMYFTCRVIPHIIGRPILEEGRTNFVFMSNSKHACFTTCSA